MPYRRPLGLSAYLALTRAGTGRSYIYPDLNPDLPVVWCHAARSDTARRLEHLCRRIQLQRDDVQFVITGAMGDLTMDRLYSVDAPEEAQADIQAFLDWCRPVLCIWTGHNLRPALMWRAAGRGCRIVAADITDGAFRIPARRWLPDCSAATLDLCTDIFATDESAMRSMRRMAPTHAKLHNSGPLLGAGLPLTGSEDLREEIQDMCAGRPIWLAAHLSPGEVQQVLMAHRAVSRYAHRCLLIAALQDESGRAAATRTLEDTGLRVCDWDNGDDIDENTQVVLSSDPDMLGVWYQLAPVTFLGGSLVTGEHGHDPYEAAALGSAILYGPNVGAYLSAYSTLVEAGAARIVRDADSLATAVRATIAPDVSAAMALAGWTVVSDGAELTDALVTLAIETIETAEARP
ncbi:3-deoxy-D-manno-octulosonic acid transferase [Pseudoprimorskyibacter insulae]|uniref:3-deoxy-D-manno-octulosonic acid transferase n=1 Tax=Pseudoprimorskyibacter insulae TaxID=1695997 RepID=A0A2R8AUR2_9RHOB|nr:glycosyltransferase N-terminal domain-containing protein [Pseudoprimorskyibacter insulae]SPF79795.1 3-deoxy-D-manno-octulosonic acid transferase [Pseudoprimorskyibacter insulae]